MLNRDQSATIFVPDIQATWKNWYAYREAVSSLKTQFRTAQQCGAMDGLEQAINHLAEIQAEFEQMRASFRLFFLERESLHCFQEYITGAEEAKVS